MAGIRELSLDTSLATLWEELVYTWTRLHARTATRDLAAAFEELIERAEKTEIGQRGHWRAEALADAAVDLADEELDDVSDDVIAEVRHADRKVDGDQGEAREARYLGPLTLGALVRLGLESQLKRVRGWTSALESEPEDALRKLGKRLAKVIVGGDAALAQRGSAAGARATHRAREITSLVADINAVRRDTYGALVRLGNKNKRPKDWPERFFRRGASSKVGAPMRGPVDPPTG